MSGTDAFLTVQERRSGDASVPSRPARFPPSGSKNTSEVVDCLAGSAVFDHWQFAFRDRGRNFFVLVAIGTQASEGTRAEPWQILNSLEFVSPRQVPMPGRPAVPDVRGLTVQEANEAMMSAGYDAGSATLDSRYIANEDVPADVITAQDPPPGEPLPPGERISVEVSAGGPVIDFEGLPAQARGLASELAGYDMKEPILVTVTSSGTAFKTDEWLFGPCAAVNEAYRTYGDSRYGDACY